MIGGEKMKEKLKKLFSSRNMAIFMIVTCMALMLAVPASANSDTGSSGITNLSSAIEFIWTQFTKMASLVTSQPILLIPVAVFCAGVAIGLVKRLIT